MDILEDWAAIRKVHCNRAANSSRSSMADQNLPMSDEILAAVGQNVQTIFFCLPMLINAL